VIQQKSLYPIVTYCMPSIITLLPGPLSENQGLQVTPHISIQLHGKSPELPRLGPSGLVKFHATAYFRVPLLPPLETETQHKL